MVRHSSTAVCREGGLRTKDNVFLWRIRPQCKTRTSASDSGLPRKAKATCWNPLLLLLYVANFYYSVSIFTCAKTGRTATVDPYLSRSRELSFRIFFFSSLRSVLPRSRYDRYIPTCDGTNVHDCCFTAECKVGRGMMDVRF